MTPLELTETERQALKWAVEFVSWYWAGTELAPERKKQFRALAGLLRRAGLDDEWPRRACGAVEDVRD